MANPTADAIAAIQAQVSDWSQTDAQIRDSLNARTLVNPNAAEQVPKPVTTLGILRHLGVPSRTKLWGRPGLTLMLTDIRAGDRDAIKNWAANGADVGDLSTAERDAVIAEVNATIADPHHLDPISWAELYLGRPVDLEDIQQARP